MDPRNRDQEDTCKETRSTEEKTGNGEWRKFPEPQAWAVGWDGATLSKAKGQQEEDESRTSSQSG